ncbi:MAG: MG2 domain-containing protein, partial [Pseudomonadota bacterium]
NELLANAKEATGASDQLLVDVKAHPLSKIALLLGDLEAWHLLKGRPEAAMEARLELLQRLYASFTHDEERKNILNDLESRFEGYRRYPWWAVGAALRAEFIEQGSDHDNLIVARKVAKEAIDVYPNTIGDQRCRYIVASIEAPAFTLDAMRSDGPDRRSIGIRYKNLTKMYFRAYPYDIKQKIESHKDYNFWPDQKDLLSLLQKHPAFEWSVDLPKTLDFKEHQAFITPPMTQSNLYAVIASADPDFKPHRTQVCAVYMVIGDLVLFSRQFEETIEVTAFSGKSGNPIAGAKVFLYRYDWQKGHRIVDALETDKEGRSVFTRHDHDGSYFLFARSGDDLAIDPDDLYFQETSKPSEVQAALIYTDRSVYRPLQKILWKAVVYRGKQEKGHLQIWPNTPVTLYLRDANNQVVEEKTLVTNDFGTASGEFLIPAGRLLGEWRIESSPSGASNIHIEEYKRPTFEARFLEPEIPLRLNTLARLKGEARYYFGLPLTNGAVKWSVSREAVYPCWWGNWYREGGVPNSEKQIIETGVSALDSEGRFSLDFTPKADERLAVKEKDITYRYSVTAEVTDEGGETSKSERSFRLGFVAVEARATMDSDFYIEENPVELVIKRTDLDGVPAKGQGNWRIFKLKGPSRALLPADQPVIRPLVDEGFRTPDDDLRPRWNPDYSPAQALSSWGDEKEVAKGEATHNEQGEARISLSSLEAGAYRIRYETIDPFGKKHIMAKEFLVAGKHTSIPLPAILMP